MPLPPSLQPTEGRATVIGAAEARRPVPGRLAPSSPLTSVLFHNRYTCAVPLGRYPLEGATGPVPGPYASCSAVPACAPPPFGRRCYQSPSRDGSTARAHLAGRSVTVGHGRPRSASVGPRSRYGPWSSVILTSDHGPHLDLGPTSTDLGSTSTDLNRPRLGGGRPGHPWLRPPLVGQLPRVPLGHPWRALRTPDGTLFLAKRPETRSARCPESQDLGILAGRACRPHAAGCSV